ncbi:unnamed protein product [Phyllotreta striolata]|uniref:Uncharacterized protein n=1 Tax=Phyllotreta striolata TaxID=444603 RepID=A0A9N9XJZ9_PHYSR|nr:unnamed protein product [Phyllotreta striolata]
MWYEPLTEVISLKNWIMYICAYFCVVFILFCTICLRDATKYVVKWTKITFYPSENSEKNQETRIKNRQKEKIRRRH